MNRPRLQTVTPSGKSDRESFFALVYDLVRQVPHGRVTSYGAIAAALGARSGARMVGWAMNNCHALHPPVPAHRVVNRQGRLSGKAHFGEPDRMQRLLEAEGVRVTDDQVQDFERLYWDPARELGL